MQKLKADEIITELLTQNSDNFILKKVIHSLGQYITGKGSLILLFCVSEFNSDF